MAKVLQKPEATTVVPSAQYTIKEILRKFENGVEVDGIVRLARIEDDDNWRINAIEMVLPALHANGSHDASVVELAKGLQGATTPTVDLANSGLAQANG